MWLPDILKQRQVSSVVWFHTDHWEPWSRAIDDLRRQWVDDFIAQSRGSRFANKSTLFYLPGVGYQLRPARRPGRFVPGDVLEFLPRTDKQDVVAREAIGNVQSALAVEFQVHLHHEQFTYNTRDWNPIHTVAKAHAGPELDDPRFRCLLGLSLDLARRETGLPLERWAFVHGNWGLNASDPTVCHIENEILILQEHGCWGDFTFPAGHPPCDPRVIEEPYSFTPFAGPRCYDAPEGDPRPIGLGTGLLGGDRFFVWNARAKHDVASLDCDGPAQRARLRHRNRIVSTWLRDSPVIADTLYIKTYAHSMGEYYYEAGYKMPLADPDVVALFDLLESACDGADVELRACTVDEVYETLQAVDAGDPDRASSSADEDHAVLELRSPAPEARARKAAPIDIHALNRHAASFLMDWVAADQTRRHAAGGYYLARIEQERLFQAYDIVAADYAASVLPKSTRCIELGSGLAELATLLATAGFSAVACESDRGRHDGAVALTEELQRHGLDLGTLALVNGSYPSALRLDFFGTGVDTALFCTNATGSDLMARMTDVLRTLRLFDHLVIDVRKFGADRDEASAETLIGRILDLGFVSAAQVFKWDSCEIRHFTRCLSE